jgi:hypothetical protein
MTTTTTEQDTKTMKEKEDELTNRIATMEHEIITLKKRLTEAELSITKISQSAVMNQL